MATELTTISQPAPILESPLPQQILGHLYSTMLKSRMLEKRIRGAAHTSEAILAGALQNTEAGDLIVSSGPHPVLEVLLRTDLGEFTGPKLRRKTTEVPGKVVVAGDQSATTIAAGIAVAFKRAQSSSLAIAIVPGKITKGEAWRQATTFAAARRVPLIIIADWTETRTSRSHEGRDLSHWPFPTIAVDGRDVIAVYRVTKEAFASARKGHGPTLVDCVNFVAPGRRGKDNRDSLSAFKGYLKRHNAWSEEYEALASEFAPQPRAGKQKSR